MRSTSSRPASMAMSPTVNGRRCRKRSGRPPRPPATGKPRSPPSARRSLGSRSLSRGRLELGRLLARRGDYKGAAEQFRYLVEVDPSNAENQTSLSLALLLAADDLLTLEALEAATETLPQSIVLHHMLARLLAASTSDAVRDGERALRLAQRVMEAEPTLDHAETVAMAMAAAGDFAGAVSWQQRVVVERVSAGDRELTTRARALLESYLAGRKPPPPWSGDES